MGSFTLSGIATVKKAINVCKNCEANKREPIWDCLDTSLDLAESLFLNGFSIYIGWQHGGTPNGLLEGADTAHAKRHVALGGSAKWRLPRTKIVLLLGFLISVTIIMWVASIKYHIMLFTKEILDYLANNYQIML